MKAIPSLAKTGRARYCMGKAEEQMRFHQPHHLTLWRRIAAVLALVAMLMPGVSPLLHAPAALAQAGSALICHSSLGAPAKDGPAQTADKSKALCPLCHSLAGLASGFITPDTPSLPTGVATPDAVVENGPLAVPALLHPARSRAPPVFA